MDKECTWNNDIENKANVLPGRLELGNISDESPDLLVSLIDAYNSFLHNLHSLLLPQIKLLLKLLLLTLNANSKHQHLTSDIKK